MFLNFNYYPMLATFELRHKIDHSFNIYFLCAHDKQSRQVRTKYVPTVSANQVTTIPVTDLIPVKAVQVQDCQPASRARGTTPQTKMYAAIAWLLQL